MNVTGIVFANDASLGALTNSRTMASLPYGGRYRLIDFHLSNMAAAGIRHVGIVSRHNYQSLINHIGSGEEWGLDLEEGGLEYLTPYAQSSTDVYRGKLDALSNVMGFFRNSPEDGYIVMADSAVLCNMDFDALLESHIASGKDLTVVTKEGIADGKKVLDLALKLDDRGQICDIAVDYVADPSYLASMDIFVLSASFLQSKIREFISRNLFHMDRDLVLGLWQKGQLSINVYPFQGVALYNDTVEEYFQNSLALIDEAVRSDLFHANHKVFTRVRDRVPSYYGENCRIDRSIVADGCILEGQVSDSVLFRDVQIRENAQVENCVIMNDTVVGEGAELKYVILDKDVTVRPGAKLIGTAKNPIILARGDSV